MKTNQMLITFVIVVSGICFGVLSIVELPQFTTELVITDIILGAILYLSYLVAGMLRNSSKTTYRMTQS
jgi:hypothetical protein